RDLLRRAEGLGDHRVQRTRRALGRRRTVAFAAAGPQPARRALRTQGALQQRARVADGRAALRRGRRSRRAGVAARAGTRAAAAGPVQLRALNPWTKAASRGSAWYSGRAAPAAWPRSA